MASDLISRSDVLELLNDRWYSRHGTTNPLDIAICELMESLIDEVEYVKAVDAVEVVRCKDCEHAVSTTNSALIKTFGENVKVCNIHRGTLCFGAYIVSNEGFCDEGARRKEICG